MTNYEALYGQCVKACHTLVEEKLTLVSKVKRLSEEIEMLKDKTKNPLTSWAYQGGPIRHMTEGD